MDQNLEANLEKSRSARQVNLGKGKADLFQDGKVFTGIEVYKVQSPKAFPSKEMLLEKLLFKHDDGLHFQEINNEIFLFTGNKDV